MWGGKFKYVAKFCIGSTGHVISRMRNDDLLWTGTLGSNISKTIGDRDLIPMEHQYENLYGESNRHVIDAVT